MFSHKEANAVWEKALRAHAALPLQGDEGPYLAIGAKTMALLNPLWARAKKVELPDIGKMLSEGKDVRIFGDPHFEHANIIAMCQRPHSGVEDMDQQLWDEIEKAHAEADFVVCVGDWSLKNPIAWQRRVHGLFAGKHATVVGNHDAKGAKPEQWAQAGAFASLAFNLDRELARKFSKENDPELSELIDWEKIPRHIMVGLSHWPIPPDRMPGPSWINLHGHIHNRADRPLRANCSVEAIGYKPKPVSEIIGARLMDDLARRQSGLAGFVDSQGRDEGDSSYVNV